jgi:L-alanine-DL-glutamate epimerase-like enolase superfamily enzyme
MKITRIDVYQVRYGLRDQKYAWSGGHAVTSFTSSIVRISTDEGVAGFGEVCPLGSAYMEAYPGGVPAGVAEVGKLLLGQDPSRPRVIRSLLNGAFSGHNFVKSPLDVACWDILGQVTGAPIAALLGGRYVDDYPLYRAISQQAPDQMAATVSRYRDEGYRRFQLKVGGDVEDDVARIRAVLKVLQRGDVLVADANTGWRTHQALQVVNAVEREDVFIEQPCPTLEECLVVRAHTDLPMVLDEVITGTGPLVSAYGQRAMDVVNIKISRVGGLTTARELRDLCQTLGVPMTIEDSAGGDIVTTTMAHLAASTQPEFLFTSTDFNSYVDLRLADDAPLRRDGRLAVPVGPGLGIHVDETRLGAPIVTIQ